VSREGPYMKKKTRRGKAIQTDRLQSFRKETNQGGETDTTAWAVKKHLAKGKKLLHKDHNETSRPSRKENEPAIKGARRKGPNPEKMTKQDRRGDSGKGIAIKGLRRKRRR